MTERKALQRLSYGMYIVSAKDGDRINGQMSNTVFQVTSEPPMISISINKKNSTHDMIARSGAFTVSVLDITAPLTLVSVFGFKHGGEVDKYKGLAYRSGKNGAPILTEHTTSFLEVRVTASSDAGTHTVFLGEVTEMDCLGSGEPMTYAFYHRELKGVTPRSAPTYMGPRMGSGSA